MFFKVTSKKNSKTGLVYNEEDQEHILHSKGVQLQFFSLNSLLERDTSHSCYIWVIGNTGSKASKQMLDHFLNIFSESFMTMPAFHGKGVLFYQMFS